ncbi:MAG TPA: nitrilase-related carbon-nitrogen hydrolase [Symbiobacteriaceae bacterium]|nr:nitrilase-related carbon-nitrogen hydrolase [Symbiobacteriaceae bacterium]
MSSFFTLAVAAVLLLFSQGKWVVPLATWLAPLLLIRFLRTQPARRGLLVGAAIHAVIFYVWYDGVIPGGFLPGGRLVYIAFVVLLSLVAYAPYAVDRWLSDHLSGLPGTLVYPLAVVTMEYLNATFNPMGGWGALGLTQTDNLPLLQLASVTGMYGISFLVAWFAGVGNWVWAQGWDWRRVGRAVTVFGAVLSLVLLGGGLRLALWSPVHAAGRLEGAVERHATRGSAFFPPETGTVRIASLSGFDYRYEGEPFIGNDAKQIDALFAATVREARAGAKIVVWAEASAMIQKQEEPALVKRAAEVAKQEGIYLLVSPYAEPAGERAINKSILLSPQGEIAWEYWKNNANLLEGTVRGDGKLAFTETPYGKLAGAICWDMDFPGYVRQAGQGQADILLAPSADWRQIDPLHTQIARLRAVENGVSLVRHTRAGLSAAYDYQGRVLASVDDYLTTGDRTMVAQVPVHGVRTLYAVIGDTFAWLSAAGLCALLAGGLLGRGTMGGYRRAA